MENGRFPAGKNSIRFVAPAWSGSQEMGKSPQTRRTNTSTNITKRDRLSTRFFAPLFSIFAACILLMCPSTVLLIPPSPYLRQMKITWRCHMTCRVSSKIDLSRGECKSAISAQLYYRKGSVFGCAIIRFVALEQAVYQEMDRSHQIRGEKVVPGAVFSHYHKGSDLVKMFGAIFSVVATYRLVMCTRIVWYRYLHWPPYAKWRSRDGVTLLKGCGARAVKVAGSARLQ